MLRSFNKHIKTDMIRRYLYILMTLLLLQGCNKPVADFQEKDEAIMIYPDYTNLTIPPNIAPLNFFIEEEGEEYSAEISSQNGERILIRSNKPEIDIPLNKWRKLLSENKGEELTLSIYVRKQGQWYRYRTISNIIAPESIHPYLAYRLINSQYAYTSNMKFSQRHLESFDETLIFENRSTNTGCFNCHSFSNYDPDKMSMHYRQSYGGTIIKDGDKIVKLNTKTQHTQSSFGYVSSSPNGDLIAYSVNSFNEYYTNSTTNLNEVTDQSSDIVVYNRKTNVVTTSPKISTANRENFPSWGPEGRFLYYLSADQAFEDFDSRFFSYYSLVRIEYNQEENSWGETDTIYNARKEGRSLTFPRVSPDGKHILFCLIDYGYFSINHEESDLYLMDLETREYRKLSINSEYNDSYHAWSQDGRWVVFSSKRHHRLYSAPHFVYFDEDMHFHKPFILPQKDPHFYETYLVNYNIPEFINGKVNLNPRQIRDILYQEGEDVIFDEEVDVDSLYFHQKDVQK
jgi:hypothetical protein